MNTLYNTIERQNGMEILLNTHFFTTDWYNVDDSGRISKYTLNMKYTKNLCEIKLYKANKLNMKKNIIFITRKNFESKLRKIIL